MAVDIAPKKASSAAALGVVDVASYIGTGIQNILSGHLIGNGKTIVDGTTIYDFFTIRYFWIGAAAMSCLFCVCLWNVKKKQVNI
jgi:OPA family sugar phosphate sensor protein UhpC-like MFS transporter